MAYRSGNPNALAVTTRHVVLANWIFTAPAVVVQLTTGMLLMKTLNYSFSSSWFIAVFSLFIFIGLCWIPVVIIQYKLKHLAKTAEETGYIDPKFKQLMRYWIALGIPAFGSILIIFCLMIFKPLPVV